MRIWSLHPMYLDSKGLVALWRETLLAKKVLEGKTSGYKNHPQLIRFRESLQSIDAINFYLKEVWREADNRNYNFDKNKFSEVADVDKIDVSSEQLIFEKNHLLGKLKLRDEEKYNEIVDVLIYKTHPLFNLIEGEIEVWEKI